MGKFQFTRMQWLQLSLLLVLVVIAVIGGYRGLISWFMNVEEEAIHSPNATSAIHRLHNSALDIEKPALFNVVFFLSKDCPLCNNYKPLLDSLQAEYAQDSRFLFLGLRTDSDAATDSSYFFPLEYNAGKDVHYIAEIFKATITPEVFVVDSSNRVWYSGAIDNWSFDTGKKRQFATEHYLKDALKALRNGQKPAVSETKAVGCYIE
jgi:thiol-disulfide isomerase/thioredoxin